MWLQTNSLKLAGYSEGLWKPWERTEKQQPNNRWLLQLLCYGSDMDFIQPGSEATSKRYCSRQGRVSAVFTFPQEIAKSSVSTMVLCAFHWWQGRKAQRKEDVEVILLNAGQPGMCSKVSCATFFYCNSSSLAVQKNYCAHRHSCQHTQKGCTFPCAPKEKKQGTHTITHSAANNLWGLQLSNCKLEVSTKAPQHHYPDLSWPANSH